MDQHVGKRAKRKWVSAICEWLEVPFWSGQSIINPKRISHFPFAFSLQGLASRATLSARRKRKNGLEFLIDD